MSDFSSRPTTVMISWSHKDEGWASPQISRRQLDVYALATALRRAGIDADADLLHDDVDWTRWGPKRVRDCDFTLVVVSRSWKNAWEGRGNPSVGAGAAAEANVLQSMFVDNREEFNGRVRLLMFPESQEVDIPDGLHGIPRFYIQDFASDKIMNTLEGLLRNLTKQPLFKAVPLGEVPVLPPALPGDERSVKDESVGDNTEVPLDDSALREARLIWREEGQAGHGEAMGPVTSKELKTGEFYMPTSMDGNYVIRFVRLTEQQEMFVNALADRKLPTFVHEDWAAYIKSYSSMTSTSRSLEETVERVKVKLQRLADMAIRKEGHDSISPVVTTSSDDDGDALQPVHGHVVMIRKSS